MGAVAKFAAGGKSTPKKDLGLMAAKYGNVYVAQVAMGASDAQTMKAFLEAEAHEGPSLIIAYSQCIAHGIDISKGMRQQKLAVDSGHWPLYRYNPARAPSAARTRSSWTLPARRFCFRITSTRRLATACSCRATPRSRSSSSAARRRPSTSAGDSSSSWPNRSDGRGAANDEQIVRLSQGAFVTPRPSFSISLTG
jgi:pyruvate-ferredoxin/flavodoxin oxidoreductase